MIDPRLASFAIGATFGLVLCGWPWHPRFSRYSFRRAYHFHGHRKLDAAAIASIGMRREYLLHPPTMAECGGPCWEAQDPRACDCGALWRDVPIKPNSHSLPELEP